MGDFSHFKDAYDDLTSIVLGANHNYLPGHLAKWFAHLDTTPVVSALVAYLEGKADFWTWYREQQENASNAGMGAGRLDFPNDRDAELGIKLELFRHIAAGRIEAFQVGYTFIPSAGGDAITHTNNVKDHLFAPMARELRRVLFRQIDSAARGETRTAPAADRVVHLDHNSEAYRQTVEALDRLEHALRSANDFEDVEERDQRVAEVKAARTLLTAMRVRVAALVELLRPLAQQFGTKLKDNLIGIAVTTVITALTALLKIVGLL